MQFVIQLPVAVTDSVQRGRFRARLPPSRSAETRVTLSAHFEMSRFWMATLTSSSRSSTNHCLLRRARLAHLTVTEKCLAETYGVPLGVIGCRFAIGLQKNHPAQLGEWRS